MARSIFHVATTLLEDDVYKIATEILVNDGYHQIDRNGETVWKKGTGAMTAMHFIKLEYFPNDLVISGWIQVGLGKAGFDESDLTGIAAVIPKKSTVKTIQKIRKAVM